MYELISSLGFPVFVAVYMLLVNRKTLEKLTSTIELNTRALYILAEKLSVEDISDDMEKEYRNESDALP